MTRLTNEEIIEALYQRMLAGEKLLIPRIQKDYKIGDSRALRCFNIAHRNLMQHLFSHFKTTELAIHGDVHKDEE